MISLTKTTKLQNKQENTEQMQSQQDNIELTHEKPAAELQSAKYLTF